jgi:hypothetical protein
MPKYYKLFFEIEMPDGSTREEFYSKVTRWGIDQQNNHWCYDQVDDRELKFITYSSRRIVKFQATITDSQITREMLEDPRG